MVGSITKISFFVLALLFGTAFTLIAQDAKPSNTVTLRVDGVSRQVATGKDTVRELLHQEKVNLNAHDRCEPSPGTPIVNGMTITITRVTCETLPNACPSHSPPHPLGCPLVGHAHRGAKRASRR